ncbi:MAG: nucleotide exchange factor GrpE [Clostridia bacterium]|nr:nucleotide exchange factor GrpE [Clostridia bacterium]
MAENVEEKKEKQEHGLENPSLETNQSDEAAEKSAETETSASEKTETEELENEIVKLQKEKEDLHQRLLRVAADFDNFRKRTRTEKEELVKYANGNLISQILPILDNFQLALDVKEPSDDVKKFLTGMEMIYRQLLQVLEQAGLAAINAAGETFDPQKHEAVMQVEDEEAADNTIVEELRRGYMFKDKVIRPSMVKVARNPGKQ